MCIKYWRDVGICFPSLNLKSLIWESRLVKVCVWSVPWVLYVDHHIVERKSGWRRLKRIKCQGLVFMSQVWLPPLLVSTTYRQPPLLGVVQCTHTQATPSWCCMYIVHTFSFSACACNQGRHATVMFVDRRPKCKWSGQRGNVKASYLVTPFYN